MKGEIAWLALACLVAGLPARAADASRERVYEARVERVFDGDTLWVRPLPDGRPRKLRLDGIDAPEICQPGGLAARDALAERIERRVVQVRERRRDHYGRPLVRLSQRQTDVAAWLVAQGHAWSYRWRFNPGPYAAEEARARAARRGVFAEASPEWPGDFRRRYGPCPPSAPKAPRAGASNR